MRRHSRIRQVDRPGGRVGRRPRRQQPHALGRAALGLLERRAWGCQIVMKGAVDLGRASRSGGRGKQRRGWTGMGCSAREESWGLKDGSIGRGKRVQVRSR